MKRVNSILLLLIGCIPHLCLALDEDQKSTPLTHTISVGEYCHYLNLQLIEDAEQHYNPETMGEEIQCVSSEDRLHPQYSVVEGINPQSPMLGLTQSDADFSCSSIETMFAFKNGTSVSDYSVKFCPTQNNSGTFEIKVEENTFPLMMLLRRVPKEKNGDDQTGPVIGRLSTADQTARNRREYGESDNNLNPSSNHPMESSSEQELTFEGRVAAALETLKASDATFNVSCHFAHRLENSKQTMACLRCFNMVDNNVAIISLMAVNRDHPLNCSRYNFILNSRETPFEFTVPSNDPSENSKTIRSPIIPVDIKSNIGSNVYSPTRTPDARENSQVKKYIYEAFEDYFGKEVADECLNNLIKKGKKWECLTIEELQQAFEKLSKLYDNVDLYPHLKEQAQQLEIESFSSRLSQSSKIKDQQILDCYSKAEEALSYSRKNLLRALDLSEETLARSAGWLGGSLIPLTAYTTCRFTSAKNTMSFSVGLFTGLHTFTTSYLLCDYFYDKILHINHRNFITYESYFYLINRPACCIATVVSTFLSLWVVPPNERSLFPLLLGSISATTAPYLGVVTGFCFEKALQAASHDFINANTLGLQAVEVLKEAQREDASLPERLTTVFEHSSEKLQKSFLSYYTEKLPEEIAERGVAESDSSLTFDQIKEIISKRIKERTAARAILIEDLKQKLSCALKKRSSPSIALACAIFYIVFHS